MQLLGDQPRLAQCLSLATAHGGWDGGQPGSGQGIACHSSFGSHVAMLVEVHVAEDQRVIVDKVTAAVDCGQVIHPDIVRQQIEGGIIWGIAGALGCTTGYENGAATATNFDSLMLPILPESPEIAVHIVPSQAASGGVGEIAVPPVAPAIANALFAAIGKRVRNLPLIV
jgi:isoquinoline 1-oxidoreductase beta subunit